MCVVAHGFVCWCLVRCVGLCACLAFVARCLMFVVRCLCVVVRCAFLSRVVCCLWFVV